jgi:hypothetical protein
MTDWQGHSPEALKAMKDHIERLRQLGVEALTVGARLAVADG